MKLIEALNRRYGRLLVGYWITIGLFAVICVTTFYLLNRYIFLPMMASLPYSASLEVIVDAMLPWNMGFALFTVAAAAFLIRYNLIEPLLRRRRALEADLAKAKHPAALRVGVCPLPVPHSRSEWLRGKGPHRAGSATRPT
jgi:hypothetical protein